MVPDNSVAAARLVSGSAVAAGRANVCLIRGKPVQPAINSASPAQQSSRQLGMVDS